MPDKEFEKVIWRTTFETFDAARTKAVDVSNYRQQSITVWGSGPDKRASKLYWVYPAVYGAPEIGDEKLFPYETIHPDPAQAPINSWQVIEQNGFTERNLRDVRVESWRTISENIAGSVNGLKPYSVKTGEKAIRIFGRRMTLYTYIVRQNPKFAILHADTFKPHPPR